MLPMHRRLPMMLSLLLLGASTVVAAAPQQRERGRRAPPPVAADADAGPARAPLRMPQAAPRPEGAFQDRRPAAPRDRGQDALSDSIRRIERNTRSQVISAERVPYDGRSVNRIKVVDDRGRVRIYVDDPQQAEAAGDTPTRDDDD